MESLDNLLESLHSDKNRLAFLGRVYTPGNVEVADRILDLNPSTSVLEKEVDYAQKHGATERFTALARRFVDYYVENNWDNLLSDKVVGWGDADIADYAVTKLEETGKESPLECAGEIAQSFGQEERGKELLERVLAVQLEKKDDFAFSPAGTYAKLGRFNKAIDFYLECDYNWLNNAISIAKEHSPQRLKEIAKAGYKRFNKAKKRYHDTEIFVECAEILGKTKAATKIIIAHAKHLNIDYPPRFYEDLVKSLVKLGINDEARRMVKKVADYQFQKAGERDRIHTSFHDEQKELAGLYETIGEQAPVRDILLAKIDAGLNGGWHPSHYTADIEKGFKLTGDKAFLERKLLLLEQEKKYDEASRLAQELEQPELAGNYKTMHQMVSAMPKKAEEK